MDRRGFGRGGCFPLAFRASGAKKKRLDDIRPDAKFGVHTRDSLLALTARVFRRLGLPEGAAPVFMTREKEVNAQAVRCELLPGIRVFNGVYLNRAIIHRLDEPELESVVGHELGHVFPYAPLLSRCYLVHSICAAAAAFAMTAAFPHPAVAFMSPLALLWLLDRVIAFPHLRLSRAIEFLCDDYGARVAGTLCAMSCEFKLGAESEARGQIIAELLEAAADGKRIEAGELYDIYEEAVPFGRADPAAARAEIERIVRQRRVEKGRISLAGYLAFLSGGDTEAQEDFAREELERLRILALQPLIPLDRAPFLCGSAAWTDSAAGVLAAAIEANPRALLFRNPQEISDQDATHPNTSRRLLFLWRNRSAEKKGV